MSCEVNPDGDIKSIHTHTPIAQERLISSEDLRLTIRMISGILNNGKIAAATTPTELIREDCSIIKLRFHEFQQLFHPAADPCQREGRSSAHTEAFDVK